MANTKQIKLFNQLELTLAQEDDSEIYKLSGTSASQLNTIEIWDKVKTHFNVPADYKEVVPPNIGISDMSCRIENDSITAIQLSLFANNLDVKVFYQLDMTAAQLYVQTNTNIQNDIIHII